MASVTKRKGTAGIGLLFITVLVLTAAPRMGVRVGPVPVYFIDGLLLLTFLASLQIRSGVAPRKPFTGIILFLLPLIVISELNGIIITGKPLEPVYEMVRMLIAISLFFSVSRIVQTEDDVLIVAKAMLIGAIVTASLMILTSLPFTRGIVTGTVLSWEFLEPAAEIAVRKYADTSDPMRGRSLIGVSILSGAFLNVCWPMAAMLYRWHGKVSIAWRKAALVSMSLVPIGIVMSYSRGAILGLLLVITGTLFIGAKQARRGIFVGAMVALVLFSAVGWDSEIFFFERLENRTQAMLENPYEDARETSRLFAYIHPFFHAAKNPEFFVFGRGNTYKSYRIADHAVFAKAYVAYGMIAAFLYLFLVFRVFLLLWSKARRLFKPDPFVQPFAQAIMISMLGMFPWILFGHAAVSSPRGAMLLFLVVGLAASLKNFEQRALPKTKTPTRKIATKPPLVPKNALRSA
jgi:hypothetical protein